MADTTPQTLAEAIATTDAQLADHPDDQARQHHLTDLLDIAERYIAADIAYWLTAEARWWAEQRRWTWDTGIEAPWTGRFPWEVDG